MLLVFSVTAWAPFALIASLDLAAPEAAPIVQLLEGMPSALQFALAHPVSHVRDLGMMSAGDCARVCAMVFGKQCRQEDGGFNFSQDSIDTTVKYTLTHFSGDLKGQLPLLPPHFFRIWVDLSISDSNKVLLIQSPDLTKMLIEGLLLAPDHNRQSQDSAVKAQIQCDAAECFAQLAQFEPARDMLRDDPVILDVLRALATEASREEAKQSAEGALMSLDPQEVVREIDVENLHVMMSCKDKATSIRNLILDRFSQDCLHGMDTDQWSVQDIVKRIVAELSRRGYLV